MSSPTEQWTKDFAARMEQKLSVNRHKGDRPGWLACSPEDLLARVKEEVAEVEEAIASGANPEEVWAEAADVGNMVAMVADSYASRHE